MPRQTFTCSTPERQDAPFRRARPQRVKGPRRTAALWGRSPQRLGERKKPTSTTPRGSFGTLSFLNEARTPLADFFAFCQRLQHQRVNSDLNSHNAFWPLLSRQDFQSLRACNQLKFQVMYSDWDSSSPCRADPVQKSPGGSFPIRQRGREGREFMASEALWGLHQIKAFRSHVLSKTQILENLLWIRVAPDTFSSLIC
jgi:hypothetical protein